MGQYSYVAYGLQLRCGFPLPGMRLRTCVGVPTLRLAEVSPEQLDAAWPAEEACELWRGRLGDGRDLTIEQAASGELLFGYGQRARFRLDAARMTLDCAPSQAGFHWQQALIGKVLGAISVMRGYEALHAAVVESPLGAVAIAGPSGAGKSTLAVELLRRGWPLFADDALTLQRSPAGVRAHPGTPHMNLAASLSRPLEVDRLGRTIAMLAGERWLAAHRTSVEPAPVGLICLLERGPGRALGAEPLPANPLLLAPYMLGLSADPERERSRFSLYADLIETTPLVRLTAGLEHPPSDLADAVEGALALEAVQC